MTPGIYWIAREKARAIHGSDIRAAGNEVEQAVRDYLKRMLPPRYYVTHGHLIDRSHIVSPQIDVIIADNFTLASLVTTQDGTEYVPATSVLAVGEVKSTYSASRQDYHGFHDKLTAISKMHRPLIENTAYGGIGPHTAMSDMLWVSPHRYMNHLYSFLLCIDAGDFDFGKIRGLLTTSDVNQLPSTAVLLNRGIVMYGDRANPGSDEAGTPMTPSRETVTGNGATQGPSRLRPGRWKGPIYRSCTPTWYNT